MKTIRQLAEELNVSKTTIRNHIKKLPENLSTIKKGNTLYLDSDTEEFIRDELKEVSDKFSETNEKQVYDLNEKMTMLKERNEELKEENSYLREQTKEKNEQIRQLSKSLDQAQQLHAYDKQALDNYKKEEQERETQLLEDSSEEKQGFWSKLFHN